MDQGMRLGSSILYKYWHSFSHLESLCYIRPSVYKLVVNISEHFRLFEDELWYPDTVSYVALSREGQQVTLGTEDMLTSCQPLLETTSRT